MELAGGWPQSAFDRFAMYFGAQDVPESTTQEERRAKNRVVVCIVLVVAFIAETLTKGGELYPLRNMILTAGFGLASYIHSVLLRCRPDTGPTLIYVFAIADPIGLTFALSGDVRSLSFLNPLLMGAIVGAGMRYGHRTMYLVWAATAFALLLVFTVEPYSSSLLTTMPFVLMLVLVPLFFSNLVRQTHRVKTIETERARIDALHEAVTERGAFLGRISHEIRSPLQTMVSALDLFEMKYDGPGFDPDIVGRMRRASLLLNTQLRDLLTLAAGDAGRLVLNPEPFEAISLLEGLVEGARPLALDRGLMLVLDVPDEPVFVVADAARIDQVLTNLVVNAIHYTRTGQIRVALQVDDAVPRRSVRFVVDDTGPGIPADILPHILSPDRVAPGTERRGEGSGLGLAIVRLLVDRLGAGIVVTSEEGRGTTFTLDVPVATAPEDAAPPGRDGAPVHAVDRSEVRPLRVPAGAK